MLVKRFRFLFLSVMLIVTSSCNSGEVIVATMPDSKTATFTVVEYTPAPGQFIGDTKSAGFSKEEPIATPEAAAAYAQQRIDAGLFISLGAFGGYVVVQCNPSIPNDGGYDFIISGNAFEHSSEPGIVWVMQDVNGNGKADDLWYELRGSESQKEGTIYDYAITYYRPEAEEQAVKWNDNQGNSGEVEYLKSFHDQPSYYPEWIDADSYTLRGTRLESQSYEKSGSGAQWINPFFGWGYADNASTEDSSGRDNYFDIAHAEDAAHNAVVLESIDFIKVQGAIVQQCGWIGEVSTEVTEFKMVVDE